MGKTKTKMSGVKGREFRFRRKLTQEELSEAAIAFDGPTVRYTPPADKQFIPLALRHVFGPANIQLKAVRENPGITGIYTFRWNETKWVWLYDWQGTSRFNPRGGLPTPVEFWRSESPKTFEIRVEGARAQDGPVVESILRVILAGDAIRVSDDHWRSRSSDDEDASDKEHSFELKSVHSSSEEEPPRGHRHSHHREPSVSSHSTQSSRSSKSSESSEHEYPRGHREHGGHGRRDDRDDTRARVKDAVTRLRQAMTQPRSPPRAHHHHRDR